MKIYKVLFADDQSEQFNNFQDNTLPLLRQRGIAFDPVHYCPCYHENDNEPGMSVVERLEQAKADSQPYDVIITDWNFTDAGESDQKGFEILLASHTYFPSAKLVLITGYPSKEPQLIIDVVKRTEGQFSQWIEMRGSMTNWVKIVDSCEALCIQIDNQRKVASDNRSSVVPEYEVTLTEDIVSKDRVRKGKRGFKKIKVVIKKKTVLTPETFEFYDNEAIAFQTVMEGERKPVDWQKILKAIAVFKEIAEEYERFSVDDAADFIENYRLVLLGNKPENTANTSLCRARNDKRCAWAKGGPTPTKQTQEGYDCRIKLDYCPKNLQKSIPRTNKKQETLNQSATRRYLRSISTKLAAVFGDDELRENIDKGLIRTMGHDGYAMAAEVLKRI